MQNTKKIKKGAKPVINNHNAERGEINIKAWNGNISEYKLCAVFSGILNQNTVEQRHHNGDLVDG